MTAERSPAAIHRSSSRTRSPSSISIASVSSTNSGLPSAVSTIALGELGRAARPRRGGSRSRSAAWSSVSGSSDTVAAFSLPPPQAGRDVEQVGARHAQEQDRRAARPVGDVLDEVEERGLAPVDVVEHEHERALARRGLEEPPDRPEGLLARRPASATPISCDDVPADELLVLVALEHRADLRLDDVGQVEVGQARRLLDRLDHREVRDALAVGQAPAAEHRRPARRWPDRNSSTRAGLPDARGPEDREELARRRPRPPPRTPAGAGRAAARGPTIGESRRRGIGGGRRRGRRGAATPGRARPCPSARAARPARPRPRRAPAGSVASPIRTSPGAACCSSRAATFTASPVTSACPALGSPGDDLAGVHADADLRS